MDRFTRKKYSQFLTFVFMLFFSFSSSLVKSAAADDLTINNSGQGSGTISGTVGCAISPTSNCVMTVANGTPLTLAATPEWHSVFSGWGAPCSGTAGCAFTFNSATTLIATFTPNLQAALIITLPDVEPKFSSLSAAYGYAITNRKNEFVLAARDHSFNENLILTDPISFILEGGKNSEYYTNVGYTTLNGYLDVQNGSVEIDFLIIQ